MIQLLRFAWIEAVCCSFAVAIFLGLGASDLVWKAMDIPISRYDALLIYVIVVQIVFVVFRLETWRELLVICAFHVIGLALEIYKVSVGSWSYPDPGFFKITGVPVFSGFMYAAVGSYICQAFRRLDLRLTGYRWLPVTLLGAASYINFYTHHFLPDARWWIAAGMVVTTWGTWVHFTVGPKRYRMPLALSFLLIGGALWVAENAATFLGAWKYPDQLSVWRMVHVGKLGSWALLVVLSFVLVTAVKAYEGVLYGDQPSRVDRRSRRKGQGDGEAGVTGT
ncbi:MAG: DUF817 domain-containing protein [Propionibacteriaceae bacterium]|nr:DUF817 domain-containing protein [Propionibacteriaceae bacterium]